MSIYLIISAILSFLSYRENKRNIFFSKSSFIFISTFITIFMSLRKEVSCDYEDYKVLFTNISNSVSTFGDLFKKDIGYTLLNKLISITGGSYEHLIFITSLFFIIPTIIFCSRLPRPFLSLNIAFSYFIVVIGFGFIRQAIAISILMLAILKYQQSKRLGYFIYTLIATLFHKTAIIFLFPGLFIKQNDLVKNKYKVAFLTITIISIIAILTYLNPSYIFSSYKNYYNFARIHNSSAKGVLYILFLNAIPSLIYLFKFKELSLAYNERKIWIIISILALACFPFLLIFRETATYRIALYFIPIQIYVGSKIPDLKLFSLSEDVWVIFLSLFSFLILVTWLSFANHAHCWLPYKSIIFN